MRWRHRPSPERFTLRPRPTEAAARQGLEPMMRKVKVLWVSAAGGGSLGGSWMKPLWVCECECVWCGSELWGHSG